VPRAAGRYTGCYVRATVSGDFSDHTLASDADLHTWNAGTRGCLFCALHAGVAWTRLRNVGI